MVPQGTDAVILELGANDALRGTDPKVTRAALTDILARLKARRSRFCCAGCLRRRTMGAIIGAFNAIYPDLANRSGCHCIRFPGGRRCGRQAQSGGRPASDGGGVDVIVKNTCLAWRHSWHDIRATQLKNRQR